MFSDPGGETACTARPAADSRDGCPKGCWLILRLGAPSLERSRAVEEQAHFQGMQPRTFPPTAEGCPRSNCHSGREGGRASEGKQFSEPWLSFPVPLEEQAKANGKPTWQSSVPLGASQGGMNKTETVGFLCAHTA